MLPKEKIGSGMGLYGTMNAMGMAVAPAIGVSLYQTMGYRFSFCLALIFAIITGVTIQFIGDKGEPEPSSDKQGTKLQIVDKKVIPIAVIIMLFAIPYCATQTFIVSYVEARRIPVSVSLFFPLYAIVLVVLRLCLKSFLDRLPFWIFLIGGSVSAFLGITFLATMHNNLTMFFSAMFMAGGYGIMCSVCQSTAILLAGKEKRGLANSTYYIGIDLGMTIGPAVGGFLYGNFNIAFFYPFMLITIPAVVLVYLFTHKHANI